MPVAGVEPARCRHRWILSPLRLPIPSYRHIIFSMKILENSLWKTEAHLGGPSEILKKRNAKKSRKIKGLRVQRPALTNRILSPARLPIPSFRHFEGSSVCKRYYTHFLTKMQVLFLQIMVLIKILSFVRRDALRARRGKWPYFHFEPEYYQGRPDVWERNSRWP